MPYCLFRDTRMKKGLPIRIGGPFFIARNPAGR